MWVITAHPSDAPGGYVARLHLTLPGPTEPTATALHADTLDALRAMLPPGLVCLYRYPSDVSVIVEAWL